MLLSNLTKTINISQIYNFKKDRFFSSITSNSKFTNKDTILIYDKNSNITKKHIYEAINNNVPAIISNRYNKFIPIPQFVTKNINKEKEKLLKKIYQNLPHKSIAITGTNGKTSVVWYISKILTLLNINNTTVGTLGYYKNGKKISEVGLTTPAYEELYKYGNSNKKQKNIYIFEASSHALDQNRLRNYPINIAAITNISNDHLDYHKKFREYKKAKLKLFTNYLSINGFAIINSRIKDSFLLREKLINKKFKVIFFGKNNLFFDKKNSFIELSINKKKYKIQKLKLNTDIELENLECAIACCLSLNIKEKNIIKVLSSLTNPPGRLQKINYKKKNSQIIIDYAHTPDALKRILKSLKIQNKKPVVLFGCGGDRDKSKRKSMGIIANNYSSRAYITDDNPRNENTSKIRKDILKYCKNAIEIPNRRKAIKQAIKELKNNENLVIAGKGHETIQIIKNKRIRFDDYVEVKKIIKE